MVGSAAGTMVAAGVTIQSSVASATQDADGTGIVVETLAPDVGGWAHPLQQMTGGAADGEPSHRLHRQTRSGHLRRHRTGLLQFTIKPVRKRARPSWHLASDPDRMATVATKTKAIGTQSQSGCVIQAKVEVGRVKYEGPKCGHKWEPGELKQQGYDSIQFDPGDGQEVVIFDPNQVKSMKEIPYNSAWKPEYNVR